MIIEVLLFLEYEWHQNGLYTDKGNNKIAVATREIICVIHR